MAIKAPNTLQGSGDADDPGMLAAAHFADNGIDLFDTARGTHDDLPAADIFNRYDRERHGLFTPGYWVGSLMVRGATEPPWPGNFGFGSSSHN